MTRAQLLALGLNTAAISYRVRTGRLHRVHRERDASTLAAGCVTLRLTWERMHERAAREAARLHTILDQRRA